MDIRGSFKVRGNVPLYELLFLEDRLVFVRIGGILDTGGGTMSFIVSWTLVPLLGIILLLAGASFFGWPGILTAAVIAAAIWITLENILPRRHKQNTWRMIQSFASVESALLANKSNFEILYRDVKKMEIIKRPATKIAALIIEGPKFIKYEIVANQDLDQLQSLITAVLRDRTVSSSEKPDSSESRNGQH